MIFLKNAVGMGKVPVQLNEMSLSCSWWKPGEWTFGSQLMFKNLIKFRGGLKMAGKLKVSNSGNIKACEEGPSQLWLGESAESSGFFCGSLSRTYWADWPGC